MLAKTCFLLLAAVTVNGASAFDWPWSGGDASNPRNLNWVLDTILQSLSRDLIHEHGDAIEVPNTAVNTSETLKILWMEVGAKVATETNALLSNLSSVTRVSGAGIQQASNSDNAKVVLQAELTLKDMAINFNSSSVAIEVYGFNALSYDGGVTIQCADNSFDVAIEITSSGTCAATLQSASIKNLSGCYVQLLDSGIFNFIKKYIFTYALSQVVKNVVDAENKALPGILNTIVQQHDICKYLNPHSTS